MTRAERLKVRKNEVKIKKRKAIKVLIPLFLLFFVGITATGTFAYFTDGEKILPTPVAEVPVYNEMKISYTDHSESQSSEQGVTVYFDISSYLTVGDTWNAPHPNIYFFIKNGSTQVRNNPTTWTNTPMIFRFDSISTINPTDYSKCTIFKSANSTITSYSYPNASFTWSGCWVKYKITDPNFDSKTGETRYIIIKRDGTNDQTANNMEISAGVKEVYIKAKAYNAQGGGSNSNYDWSKLEIKY